MKINTNTSIDRLHSKHHSIGLLCKKLDINYEVNAFNFLEYYNDSFRHYHNRDYVSRLFFMLDTDYVNLEEIEMAILLHKSIYVIDDYDCGDFDCRCDSDDRSADYAVFLLRALGLNKSSCSRIKKLINKTSNTFENEIFQDLKRSILGSSSKEYSKYCKDIRKEYRTKFSEEEYCNKRILLLNGINTDKVFKTELFNNTFGKMAKTNIEKEIKSLEGRDV